MASSSAIVRQETWPAPHRPALAAARSARRRSFWRWWRSAPSACTGSSAHVLLAEGVDARLVAVVGDRHSGRADSSTARSTSIVLLWRNLASTERRAAVVQKATDWELPGLGRPPDRPTLARRAADRRGDRQPRRAAGLSACRSMPRPAGCRSRWRPSAWSGTRWSPCSSFKSSGNTWRGNPNWLLTWLMVPFVLAGVWTLFALVRQVLLTVGIGTTLLEFRSIRSIPGGTYEAFVSQTGRLHVRWFQVQLVCEEQAIYQQGHRHADGRRDRPPRNRVQPAEVRHPAAAAFETHFTVAGARERRCIRFRPPTTRSLGRSSSAAAWLAGAISNAAFRFTCIRRVQAQSPRRRRFPRPLGTKCTDDRRPHHHAPSSIRRPATTSRAIGSPADSWSRARSAVARAVGRAFGPVVHGRQGRRGYGRPLFRTARRRAGPAARPARAASLRHRSCRRARSATTGRS